MLVDKQSTLHSMLVNTNKAYCIRGDLKSNHLNVWDIELLKVFLIITKHCIHPWVVVSAIM